MPKHIMVDLETLGVSHNAVILSIGAAEFDPYSDRVGQTYYANVEAASCMKTGLTVDASTVYFWLEQDCKAREALLQNRVSIQEALGGLRTLLQGNYVWAHATFDPVILANAYNKIGTGRAFNYKDVRDLRTLYALTPGYADCPLYAERAGVGLHDALCDTLHQVKVAQWCFKQLREKGL